MKDLWVQLSIFIAVGASLSACGMAMNDKAVMVEDEVVEASQEAVIEAAPELPSLFFKWDISKSNIISAPIEVRNAAIAACKERGFDTGDMVNLSISGTIAEAEFGCRGAD